MNMIVILIVLQFLPVVLFGFPFCSWIVRGDITKIAMSFKATCDNCHGGKFRAFQGDSFLSKLNFYFFYSFYAKVRCESCGRKGRISWMMGIFIPQASP